MANQIIGRPETKEDALLMAQALMPVDPYKEKRKRETVRPQLVEDLGGLINRGVYEGYIGVQLYEAHEEPVDMSIAEQHHLNAAKLQRLPTFGFLHRPATSLTLSGFRMPVNPLTEDELAAREAFAYQIRLRLMRRDGVPIAPSSPSQNQPHAQEYPITKPQQNVIHEKPPTYEEI